MCLLRNLGVAQRWQHFPTHTQPASQLEFSDELAQHDFTFHYSIPLHHQTLPELSLIHI